MKIVGNSLFQKAANSALILNYLRTHPSCSRQQMAADLGLQASTVTYIINRLIKARLVEEFEAPRKEKKGSGRRPISVRLIADFGYVIGLDLQVDYYCAVICDVSGTVLNSLRKEYATDKHDFQTLLIQTVLDIQKTMVPGIPVLGMGLALPGIVNRNENIVKNCWTHNLKNINLSSFLDDAFSFPVIMENDANCCAQNILWNVPERENDSFIYLLSRFHKRKMLPQNLPSIGIGIGLVLNGQLYTGISNEAGEYQSILFSKERQLEWQLSLTGEEMDRALYDPEIQKEIIRELMGNMTFLLQVLNPSVLYIGGDLSHNSRMIQNILSTDYNEKWESLQNKGCRLIVQEDGSKDPAMGAAACMLSELYAIPQVGSRNGSKKKWNTLLGNVINENN